jgi:glycosyltransferase involved in cell wall biosynthesis
MFCLFMSKTIWLITPADAVPGEKWGYKHGIFLADSLTSRGFKVVYWTSSFSHALKQQRSLDWEDRVINSSLTVRIVPCRSYAAHVSLRRIMSLFDFARGLLFKGWVSERPDSLVVSMPTLFGEVFSVWLARKHKAVLILDFRDLWPEIFKLVLPQWARRFSRLIFAPLYLMRNYAFRNADGFTSVCETYRQLAFMDAPKLKECPSEIVYSTGVNLHNFRADMLGTSQGLSLVVKESNEFWAIYAGTIGNNYDIDTLLQASILLQKIAPQLKIIVAGDGPLRDHVQQFITSSQAPNVIYVGVLDMPTLCRYYARCDIGLSIYAVHSTVSIPAKAFDYFAAELPIVNSVEGEFEELLKDNAIGFQYCAGNPQSLADALAVAISEPSGLLDMKSRLCKLAPDFDRDVQYSKFVDLIERVSRSSSESC